MNDVIENTEIERNIEAQEQPVEVELASAVTTDKPDHSKARACLYVDGLSVLGFNPAKDRAEFGFFKDMHHPIVMKIYDKNCKLVWSTERKADFPYSSLGAEVTINTTGKGMGSRYHNSTDDSTDFEDFRKLPALQKWHGRMQTVPNTGSSYLSARVNVNEAVFYTHQMSSSKATIYADGKPTSFPVELIGRIPGADILCDSDKKLEIEISPLNVSTPVKISLDNENNPYTIVIWNRDNDPANSASHFALLYNIFYPTAGGKRFSLKFQCPEPLFSFCSDSGGKDENFADISILSNQFECQVFVDGEGGW